MSFSKRAWDQSWDRLYQWARRHPGLPVRDVWDFKTMTYDFVMKARWESRVKRPFYRNAPRVMVAEAQDLANRMRDRPDLVKEIFEVSQKYREDKP